MLQNAVHAMERYINLQKMRFTQLVKQYSQHVSLKETEKCIKHQIVTTEPISEVFRRMKELYIKVIYHNQRNMNGTHLSQSLVVESFVPDECACTSARFNAF